MLNQFSRRLMPIIGRATHNADGLNCLFGGLKITTRSNHHHVPTNLIAARRTIGSVASLPSAPLTLVKPRTLLSAATNYFAATNNNILVGTLFNTTTHQTRGFASKKHKRVIKLSKGFRGRANRCFRVAIRRLEKSWQYAYRDRKVKKREFRKLWIQRLNAGVRQQGLSYSRFIEMEGRSGVKLDRKILSELAMYEPFSFKAVVDVVKKMSS
jgi:large subunit ribosomal protein L20